MSAARLDHLVVVAPTLAAGEAWCIETLGVVSGPGGSHPLMGTHNRLLRIATVDDPRAYLEIIAIDPGADGARKRAEPRWFGMDEPGLAQALQAGGPRLVHFVASVPGLPAALGALDRLGIDGGEALEASRMTPKGELRWSIAVRADGRRLFDGCLPTLIQWGDMHPAPSMPASGVTLESLAVSHPRATELRAAYDAIGLERVRIQDGDANLTATLHTPRGRITIESKGL